MDKCNNIIDYYEGNLAYTYFLLSFIFDKQICFDNVIEKKNITAAKVSCISNILLGIREELLEKENKAILPKIDAKYLELAVDTIATKTDDGYLIDGYLFKDASNLIWEIRNKLAHGNFMIDFDNNKVILKKDDYDIKIDIDKLSKFIANGLGLYLKVNNSTIYKRDIIVSNKIQNNRVKPITNKGELRGLLGKFQKVEFIIRSRDNTTVKQEYVNLLEEMIKDFKDNRGKITTKFLVIERFLKEKYDFSFKNVGINKIAVNELADYLFDVMPNGEYDIQVQIIGFELQRHLENKYNQVNAISSNLRNLILLDIINEKKSFDKNVIINEIEKRNIPIYVNYDLVAATAIGMFNSLFSYALDDVYINNNKYTTDENNGLAFDKLDLSLMSVKENTIDEKIINELNLKLISKIKENKRLDKIIYTTINDLEKVGDKEKAVLVLNTRLKKLQEEKLRIEKELLVIKNEISKKEYYRDNNIKYLTNESIVNGIRNSIAHGNYRVIFMGELSKSKIIFDDIYEGKLTFYGEISILDFINMIANNLIVILSFIEKTEILKKYK